MGGRTAKLILVLDLLAFWLLYGCIWGALFALPIWVLHESNLDWAFMVCSVVPWLLGLVWAIRKTRKWHSKKQDAVGVQRRADEHLGEVPKNANRQS